MTAKRILNALVFALIAALAVCRHVDPAATGSLRLSISDAGTGLPTAARVETLDAAGNAFTADDALPVGGS